MQLSQTTEFLINNQPKADRVEITFYTDPLCCWSWGFEPQWRRLQYEYQQFITFRNVMSGLLPGWNNYNDPVFSINRPGQMAPAWYEASQTSGMEMFDKIWMKDPPASSYPACIAVKCAELQSIPAGIQYLRMAREAVMLHGKNIAQKEILINIATKLAAEAPGLLNVEKFTNDLTGTNGIEAFRADLNEVQSRNITRFPTLIIRSQNKPAIMITGYRPYAVLLDAISQFLPSDTVIQKPFSPEAYTKFWGTITQREIEEAFTQ